MLHPQSAPSGEAEAKVEIHIDRGAAAVAGLGREWDELVESQAVPNATLTAGWLSALVAWEPGEPWVVSARRDGRLVAGGAFGVRRAFSRVGPRVATWLGTENYWFSPDLVVAPGETDAGRSIVQALVSAVDMVEISAPADGPVAAALRSGLTYLEERPRTELWVTPLPPPRMEYAADRVAYDHRRAERRGASIAIDVARTPSEVRDALERMFVVHRVRWDGRAGEIVRFSADESHRTWYRAVVAGMADRDAVRIIEVREGERLVASLLGMFAGTGAMLHIFAVDPGEHLRQPGHTALLAWVNEAMGAGARAMDLCWGAGGANSPKSRLGPTGIPIHEFRGASSRPHHGLLVLRRRMAAERVVARQRLARARGIAERALNRRPRETS